MNNSRGPEVVAPPRTRSALKIVLIALILMAVSQLIGTLISVSTFETLLLTTLTDKYEILGKNLKRKIEHSLKFGKRLDHFVGMDKLVAPVYRQTEDIHEVMIFNRQGRLFFYSQRNPASSLNSAAGETSTHAMFRVDVSQTRTDLPVSFFTRNEPNIVLYQNKYHVLFPIQSLLDNTSGVLALTFHQSVLDDRKQELMQDAWGKLFFVLLLTAAVMGIMIHLFFNRPLQRQSRQLLQKIQQTSVPEARQQPTQNGFMQLAA